MVDSYLMDSLATHWGEVICHRSYFTRGKLATVISNGNRTEWSPVRSVIIRVITKSDDRTARVWFVYREYDYRLNWTTRSLITNFKKNS